MLTKAVRLNQISMNVSRVRKKVSVLIMTKLCATKKFSYLWGNYSWPIIFSGNYWNESKTGTPLLMACWLRLSAIVIYFQVETPLISVEFVDFLSNKIWPHANFRDVIYFLFREFKHWRNYIYIFRKLVFIEIQPNWRHSSYISSLIYLTLFLFSSQQSQWFQINLYQR